MPEYIVKRDGTYETWDSSKIHNAINKAVMATIPLSDTNSLSTELHNKVIKKINGHKSMSVEDVQNLVETVLMENDATVAKSYILYREERRRERERNLVNVDTFNLIDDYLKERDWRLKENSNVQKSFQGLTLSTNGAVQSRYWLNHLPENVRNAHINGDYHIHDLSMALCGYCCGHSLYNLLLEGFNLENYCSSAPGKHLDSVLSQMINFLGTLQNEWSGAQAFSSVDTLLAPFVYYDSLRWKEDFKDVCGVENVDEEKFDKYVYKKVKQAFQRFIFNLNTTSRWGGQTVFSNLTFDIKPNKFYKDQPAVVGGKMVDKTYSEFQKEMDIINKVFIEVMLEGDMHNRIFTFPIPTYNINKEDFFDSEVGEDILKMTSKYGMPYFQNFMGSDLDSSDVFSFCPLHPDTLVNVKINGEILEKKICDLLSESDFEVMLKGTWYSAKLNSQFGKYITITTIGGVEIKMGLKHQQPIKSKNGYTTVFASEITEGDLLPFIVGQVFSEKCTDYSEKWDAVSSISISEKEEQLYCFEVDNEEQLFQLANGLVTHNCRLSLDKNTIKTHLKNKNKTGGLFGAGDMTGSIGVVTLNLPRYAFLAKKSENPKESFFSYLKYYANLAKTSLVLKREMLEKNLKAGLYPWTKRYLSHGFDSFFSTIGILGMHEACLNLLGEGIQTSSGLAFAKETLYFLRELLAEFQEETGNLFNLEATPAEGTSYRLAKIDKVKHKSIIQADNTKNIYYTNSTNLPVGQGDLLSSLFHQNELQPLYTGGTVFHVYLGESIADTQALKEFIIKTLKSTKLPYLSITPTFSICTEHGYIKGEHETCPTCGKETECYSRVVGYFRPIKNWNKGKQSEWKDRNLYGF